MFLTWRMTTAIPPLHPAVADILRTAGAMTVYAVDTLFTRRMRVWNLPEIQPLGRRLR